MLLEGVVGGGVQRRRHGGDLAFLVEGLRWIVSVRWMSG